MKMKPSIGISTIKEIINNGYPKITIGRAVSGFL